MYEQQQHSPDMQEEIYRKVNKIQDAYANNEYTDLKEMNPSRYILMKMRQSNDELLQKSLKKRRGYSENPESEKLADVVSPHKNEYNNRNYRKVFIPV